MDALSPLHLAVWDGDLNALRNLVKQGHDVDAKDPQGNTTLHLALKLRRLRMVRLLLAAGAEVKLRDSDYYTAANVSLSTLDFSEEASIDLFRAVFDQAQTQTYSAFCRRIPRLVTALERVPDFFMEMSWQFSSWVPLVGRILPGDVYKIWKRGSDLRIDATLLGMESLRWKRGHLSFLFRGGQPFIIPTPAEKAAAAASQAAAGETSETKGSEAAAAGKNCAGGPLAGSADAADAADAGRGRLLVLDRVEKTSADLMEGLAQPDPEMAEFTIAQLLTNQVRATNMWSKDVQFKPQKSWLRRGSRSGGGGSSQLVGGRPATAYDMSGFKLLTSSRPKAMAAPPPPKVIRQCPNKEQGIDCTCELCVRAAGAGEWDVLAAGADPADRRALQALRVLVRAREGMAAAAAGGSGGAGGAAARLVSLRSGRLQLAQEQYVNRGTHCVVVVEVCPGDEVRWGYHLQGHDIGFTARLLPPAAGDSDTDNSDGEAKQETSDGDGDDGNGSGGVATPEDLSMHNGEWQGEEIMEWARICPDSEEEEVGGLWEASDAVAPFSRLLLVWDNSYSRWRAKTVHYTVTLVPQLAPAEDAAPSPAAAATAATASASEDAAAGAEAVAVDGVTLEESAEVAAEAASAAASAAAAESPVAALSREADGAFLGGRRTAFARYFGCQAAEGSGHASHATFAPVPAVKRSTKAINAGVYMSSQFPLTTRQLLPIAEVMARTASHFDNFHAFLASKLPPGFPVRFDLPVFPSIYATVTFQDCVLESPEESLFHIPTDFAHGAYVDTTSGKKPQVQGHGV